MEGGGGGFAFGWFGGGESRFGLCEKIFGATHTEFYRTVSRVAADGVHLEFAGHERQMLHLRRERFEETFRGGEFQSRAGNGVAVLFDPFDDVFVGPSAMVADTEKTHRVGDAVGKFFERGFHMLQSR